jgi:hypothetical protein
MTSSRSAAYDDSVVSRRISAAGPWLVAGALVTTGLVLGWLVRKRWTDHDVSDPGVTL